MKTGKSIYITLLCGLAILVLGYGGIVFFGELVLKSATEPEEVTMDADISKLFYSKIEDDIQLYPWNYYPKEQNETVGFMDYSPYVENDVFYNLIAMAAEVEPQEVRSWYAGQEKTIMDNMLQGQEADGSKNNMFFYDEVIRLSGKDYRVKISCSPEMILSFSCIQCREEDVMETKEWSEQKEQFIGWLESNPEAMTAAWEILYMIPYEVSSVEQWYAYVELYQAYLSVVSDWSKGDIWVEQQGGRITVESAENTVEIYPEQKEHEVLYNEMPIQMIEVKDSMLIMMESDITMGLYYDVLNQRVVGFHYFYE